MKLSRIAWFVLGFCIFAVASVTLYSRYSKDVAARRILLADIASAQKTLSAVTGEKKAQDAIFSQLQAQIADAETELASAGEGFPSSVESIEYSEALTKLGDSLGLRLVSIMSTETAEEEVEDIAYLVSSFNIEVAGKTEDLLKFVDSLSTDPVFNTGLIDGMEITEMDKEETLLHITFKVFGKKSD